MIQFQAITVSSGTSVIGDSSTAWDGFNVSTAAGAVTMTLPSASYQTGRILTFLKTSSDTSAVTITPASGDTINGLSSIATTVQYAIVTIISVYAAGAYTWVIMQNNGFTTDNSI